MIDQCRRILHLAPHVRENKVDKVQYQAQLSSQDLKHQTQAFVLTTSHQVDKILLESQLRLSLTDFTGLLM